jgi:hypothetical protein
MILGFAFGSTFGISAEASDVYRLIMNSVGTGCPKSPMYLSSLAEELKWQHDNNGLTAEEAASGAQNSIDIWCKKQLGKVAKTPKYLNYCNNLYRTKMEKFIDRAFAGADKAELARILPKYDKTVGPTCTIADSYADRRDIYALAKRRAPSPGKATVPTKIAQKAQEPAPIQPDKPLVPAAGPVAIAPKPLTAQELPPAAPLPMPAAPAAAPGPVEAVITQDQPQPVVQPNIKLVTYKQLAPPPVLPSFIDPRAQPFSLGEAQVELPEPRDIDTQAVNAQFVTPAAPEAPIAPPEATTSIPSEIRITDTTAEIRETKASGDPVRQGLNAVSDKLNEIAINSGLKGSECPLADDFARWIGEGGLQKGGLKKSNEGIEVNLPACKDPANFDQVLLNEAQLIANELPALQAKAPKDSVFRRPGGGFRQGNKNKDSFENEHEDDGVNIPMMAGNKVIFPGNLRAASYCSGGPTGLLTRAAGRVDNGLIFKYMTKEQLDNFIPFKMDEHGNFRKVLHDNEKTGEGQGLFGIANNSRNGIWDFNQLMANGKHALGKFVNTIGERNPFVNACAGNLMQWDRGSWSPNGHYERRKDRNGRAVGKSTWVRDPGEHWGSDANYPGGHTGMFLGKVGDKVYFWSSNRGTKGYGVTCENANHMKPKIVAIKDPYQLAAIPPFTGQYNLRGKFDEARLKKVLEEKNTRLPPRGLANNPFFKAEPAANASPTSVPTAAQ